VFQALEDLRPVRSVKAKRERLRAGAGRCFQAPEHAGQVLGRRFVSMREQWSAIAVMSANQPQDKLGISRLAERRQ
jgi:hypothetical protein